MGLYAEDDFFLLAHRTSYPWLTSDPVGVIANGARDYASTETTSAGGVWVPATPSLGYPPASLNQGASVGEHFLYDFYDRIWVIPAKLFARNPTLNVDINFQIWNAFFRQGTETLATITATGSGVGDVALQFAAPQVYKSLELRTVALQVTVADPTPINVEYQFHFTDGVGYFNFQAIQSTVLTIFPEVPVTESWVWKTSIQVSFNGTEQRQQILTTPRREIEYDMLVLSDDEYQSQLNALYNQLGAKIIIPFFQYATEITQPLAAGGSRVYFDASRTDMRQGELVYFIGKNGTELAQIATLYVDGALLTFPLVFDLLENDVIIPCASTFVANKTKIAMDHYKDGVVRIHGRVLDFRSSLTRPGSSVSYATIDGFKILDRRPVVTKSADIAVDTGAHLFDYESGPLDQVSYWNANRLEGEREFLVQRIFQPSEMDWWRDFLGTVAGGMRSTFLMPSWRPDLTIHSTPSDAAISLTVEGNYYSQSFFPLSTSFLYLMVETDGGTYYTKVTSATPDGTGHDVLDIYPAAPSGLAYRTVNNISFLVKSRLGSDRVVLQHSALATLITLTIRSSEQ